jgi:arabinofuranosyltransferase
MSERTARVAVLTLWLLFALWGLCYIYRTSVAVAGHRIFLLWDDGMISMRYARNLAEGHGLTWNPDGERVQGITNLGLTLLMALIHLLPVSLWHTSLVYQLLSLGAATACVALVYRLTVALFRDPAVGVAATLATALYAPLAIWSLQGADVPAVALPVLAAAVWLVEAERAGRPWPAGAFPVLATAILVRPDATVTYVVVLAFCAWREGTGSPLFRRGGLLLLVIWLGLLAFGYLYYGDPLPNTYYLKATGSPRLLVLASGLRQTVTFVAAVSPLLVLLMAALLAPRLRRDRALVLAVAVVSSAFAYNIWVGGDWVDRLPSRFVAPVMPIFVALLMGAWTLLCRGLGERAAGARSWLFATGAVALALQVNPPGALAEWLSFRVETLFKEQNANQARLGLYLRDHTDPGTTVAFHWAGTAAYLGERPGIDVLGKSDRHIAKMTVDRFIPAHSKWDWDYVVGERRPDLFLEQTRGLLRRPDFNQAYRAALTGEGDWIFVRRGSESRLHDPKIAYVEIGSLREAGAEP